MASWWNSKNWIQIRHPGYDDGNNTLLLLYALDHPLGGIHYQTALTACGILAGNRWDGVLTPSRTYSPQPPPANGILVGEDAYFHLPDCQPKPTDTGEDAILACRYPVVRSFEDWKFSHGNLPPIWEAARTPPSNADDVAAQASSTSTGTSDGNSTAPPGAQCQLCDYPNCDAKPWMLVPNLFWKWFVRNDMHIYLQTAMSKPNPNPGDDEVGRIKRMMETRQNAISLGTNCFSERHPCDLPTALAIGQFSFAPKYETDDSATLVAHMFAPQMGPNGVYWDGGLQSARDGLLQRPEILSLEMLFSRFALNVFHNLDLFLKAGAQRDLLVLDHKDQPQYATVPGGLCAELFLYLPELNTEHHDSSFRFQLPPGTVVCDQCDQVRVHFGTKCTILTLTFSISSSSPDFGISVSFVRTLTTARFA